MSTQNTFSLAPDFREIVLENQGKLTPEHFGWQNYEPENSITMPQFIYKVAGLVADPARESLTTDTALGVFRNDFERANRKNLATGLYNPPAELLKGPKKQVKRVTSSYTHMDVADFPGLLPANVGVTVSEELYDAIIKNPAYVSQHTMNRVEKANIGQSAENMEAYEDLGGEAVYYVEEPMLHRLLEHENNILEERHILLAVNRAIKDGKPRREKNLAEYLFEAEDIVQETIRIACKGLGYGTNHTQKTQLAAFSERWRSPRKMGAWLDYTFMAGRYSDAVLGQITRSQHAIMKELSKHAIHLINNIDREYTDKKPQKKQPASQV